MLNLLTLILHALCSICKRPCSQVIQLQQDKQELQGQLDYINRDMQIRKAKLSASADRIPRGRQ